MPGKEPELQGLARMVGNGVWDPSRVCMWNGQWRWLVHSNWWMFMDLLAQAMLGPYMFFRSCHSLNGSIQNIAIFGQNENILDLTKCSKYIQSDYCNIWLFGNQIHPNGLHARMVQWYRILSGVIPWQTMHAYKQSLQIVSFERSAQPWSWEDPILVFCMRKNCVTCSLTTVPSVAKNDVHPMQRWQVDQGDLPAFTCYIIWVFFKWTI